MNRNRNDDRYSEQGQHQDDSSTGGSGEQRRSREQAAYSEPDRERRGAGSQGFPRQQPARENPQRGATEPLGGGARRMHGGFGDSDAGYGGDLHDSGQDDTAMPRQGRRGDIDMDRSGGYRHSGSIEDTRSDYAGANYGRGQNYGHGGSNREFGRDDGERGGGSYPDVSRGGYGGGREYGHGAGNRDQGPDDYGRDGGSHPDASGVGYGGGREYGHGSGNRQQGPDDSGRGGGSHLDGYFGGAVDAGHRGRGPRGYRRSDERLREDICERLTEDPMIDAGDIEISCSGGVVSLAGEVEARWMKHHVEDLVDRCTGVSDIENRLRVRQRAGERPGPDQHSPESSNRLGGGSGGRRPGSVPSGSAAEEGQNASLKK